MAVFLHFCRKICLGLISRFFCTVFSACNCLLTSHNCLLISKCRGAFWKLNGPKQLPADYWFRGTLPYPFFRDSFPQLFSLYISSYYLIIATGNSKTNSTFLYFPSYNLHLRSWIAEIWKDIPPSFPPNAVFCCFSWSKCFPLFPNLPSRSGGFRSKCVSPDPALG